MEENLLSVDGQSYYFDIDSISDYIKISKEDLASYKKYDKSKNDDINPTTMVNMTKYEMVKIMVDVVINMGFNMNIDQDMDETERLIKGVETDNLDNMPLPFKMAFNTLTMNKLIKTYESTNRKNTKRNPETKK